MALIGNIHGERGNRWFEGSGDPNSLPFVGELEGDMYLDGDTGDVWQFQSATNTWIDTGENILGPQGPQGIQGPQGPAGAGGVPIGGIIAWMGALVGLPVPIGFQLCNGGVITDSESLFVGLSTPALNGTNNTNKRFLRGTSNTATIGNIFGASQHSHLPATYSCTSHGVGDGADKVCGANVQFGEGSGGSPVADTVDHIPPSIETQFIMRIK